jgi:hypothetical protein
VAVSLPSTAICCLTRSTNVALGWSGGLLAQREETVLKVSTGGREGQALVATHNPSQGDRKGPHPTPPHSRPYKDTERWLYRCKENRCIIGM